MKRIRWLYVEAAVLFVLFFSIYVRTGTQFPDKIFTEQDIFFDADVGRVTGDLTDSESASYYRTNAHPIFLLLFKPFASLLIRAGVNGPRAVIYINAFLGGLAVLLSLLFFTVTTEGLWLPFLFSCLLGFSFSHLFFSSLPETYMSGSCSIIFCYLLLAMGTKWTSLRGKLAWVLAGVFSLGTTVSNAMHAVSASFFSIKGNIKTRVMQSSKIMLAAFLVVVMASIFQKAIYPSSYLFFLPSSLLIETEYVYSDLVTEPSLRIRRLLEGSLVFNFVAPMPSIDPLPKDEASQASEDALNHPFPIATFIYSTIRDFEGPRMMAAMAWILLLGSGLVYCFKDRRDPMVLALLTGVGFQLALHSVYGWEPFLYSPHVTFPVLALVALGIGRRSSVLWIAFVSCVLALIALNNLSLVSTILKVYAKFNGS